MSRRTPTVLQMEAAECGAASLSMMLAYFGRHVPLAELREACGVSRDGSNAKNILRAARSYGLDAKAKKKSVEALESGPLPAIIHWNFDHFLVVDSIRGNRAKLNDPACGRRTVSREELDRAFTGITIELAPGEEFETRGTPPTVWHGLMSRSNGLLMPLAFLTLASVLMIVPGLVMPALMRVFVDDVLIGGHDHWLVPLMIGLALTACVRGALTWLQGTHLVILFTKLSVTASARFVWHTLRLPVPFFFARYAGDISDRIDANDGVARLLSYDATRFFLNVMMALFYGALLLAYDAPLTVVGVTIAGLNLGLVRWLAARRIEENQRLQQEHGKLAGTAVGGLQLIETLKAGGAESDFFARWAGYWAKAQNSAQALAKSSMLMSAGPGLVSAASHSAVLTLGALRVIDGELTIGALVAFQTLLASFLGPVEALVDLTAQVQDAEADIARLDDVLGNERAPGVDDDSSEEAYRRLFGSLRIEHVEFGYTKFTDALMTDFSLSLAPGQRVALVGGSGSGKSTVARLVAGLYQPWAGRILFDGVPRDELPRAVLEDSVAMVDQEIFLFEGSIRDNLTLWDASVDDAAVIQAAKDAEIHDAIVARAGGYDAMVEETGRNFSGGQRQRLEIARALVRNPSLLILDEATSALDPKTEQMIDDNLRRRGCACLIVAHRLSTVRDCDEIIVMERGQIVERGNHQSLMNQRSTYAALMAHA